VKCEGLMAGTTRNFFSALAVMLAPIQLGMNYVNKMAMDRWSTSFSHIFSVHHKEYNTQFCPPRIHQEC